MITNSCGRLMKPPSSGATILLLSLSSDLILEAQCNNVTHLFKGDQIVSVNSTDLSNATQVVFNFPLYFNYIQFLGNLMSLSIVLQDGAVTVLKTVTGEVTLEVKRLKQQ